MAVVYPNCNSLIAHMEGVGAYVNVVAQGGAAKARSILAAHRHSGASYIDVTRGTTDSFINLNDPGGDALAIEFGRTGTMGRGTSRGVHALQGAF